MSRFYGDFDPASTATTTIFTVASTSRGIVEAVAQNFFPFESTAANLASGDGVFTSVGAFSYSSAVGTPYGAGTALRVENGAHMTITSAGAVEMMEFSSAFTFEFWAYRESGANSLSSMMIFDSRNNGDNPNNCLLVSFNSGKLVVSPGASGGANAQTASTAGVVDAWQHYAIARDSSMQMRMFYDGVKKFDASYTIVSDNKATGGAPHFFETVNNTFPFTGYFRDLRIFKDVCIYTTAFPVTTQPLQATSNNINISTATTVNTRSHSHVWNYPDVYDARFADTWPSTTIDSRISLYLPFEDDTLDKSSYNHTLTTSGPITLDTSQAKFGSRSARFAGSSYLTISDNSVFDLNGTDFTIEMFVYFPESVGSQAVISKWTGGGTDKSFIVMLRTDAGSYFYWTNDGTNNQQVQANDLISVGQWTHIAVTQTGSGAGSGRLFINGNVQSDTDDFSGIKNTSTNVIIGGRDGGTVSPFNGFVEDLRVIKGLSLYTTAFTVPTAPVGTSLIVNP